MRGLGLRQGIFLAAGLGVLLALCLPQPYGRPPDIKEVYEDVPLPVALTDAGPDLTSIEGVAVSFNGSYTGATSVLSVDFESGTVGNPPPGWTTYNGGGTLPPVVSGAQSHSPNQSVQLDDPDPAYGSWVRHEVSLSCMVAEFWWWAGVATGAVTFLVSTDTVWDVIRVGMGDAGLLIYDDYDGAGGTVSDVSYDSGRWYLNRVEAWSNGTYNWLVDGAPVVIDARAKQPVIAFMSVAFNTGGDQVGFYHVDDVLVRTGGAAAVAASWDFDVGSDGDGDGITDNDAQATGFNATHTYGDNGEFHAQLTVVDDTGVQWKDRVKIAIGNVPPSVAFVRAPYVSLNVTFRIAGEKWHDVNATLYKDAAQISQFRVVRKPGSPDEQAIRFPEVEAETGARVAARLVYTTRQTANPTEPLPHGSSSVMPSERRSDCTTPSTLGTPRRSYGSLNSLPTSPGWRFGSPPPLMIPGAMICPSHGTSEMESCGERRCSTTL